MKKVGKIISGIGIGAILACLVTGDILVKKYYGFIDEGLNGTGIEYDDEAEKTLAKGNAFVGEIMKEGIVMMKNTSNKAPLKDVDKVNVFGWSSTDAGFVISGYGSGISRIPENKRVLFYKGLDKYNKIYRKKKVEYNTELKSFYEDFCSRKIVSESLGGDDRLYTNYNPKVEEYTKIRENGKSLLENAKEFSDAAIIVISRQSGEGQDCPQMYSYNYNTKGGSPVKVDRGYLSLTDEEIDMINMVKENFGNVTVLLNTTNAIESGIFADPKIQNVYYVGATGQSGAFAIPKVLKGDINPSGRLTETYSTDFSEDPSFYNSGRVSASTGSVTYVEDIYVGYKWYETANEEGYWDNYKAKYEKKSNGKTGYDGIVQYPFGYGLSYTNFEYEILDDNISPKRNSILTKDSKIDVKVKVKNTGEIAGKYVVQLYYSVPYTKGGIEKSSINLGDFAKTKLLKPGEEEIVNLSIDAYSMASYDCYDKNKNNFTGYELEKGDYQIKIMKNVHELSLDKDKAIINYKVNEAIKFDKDPINNQEVKNRFTGEDAFGGVPTDGSTSKENIKYLSRENFKDTFNSSFIGKVTNSKSHIVSDADNFDTVPAFNENNGLYLYTDKEGNKLSLDILKSPEGDKIKVNTELMNKLGKDYNDPEWEKLLNQMSPDEMAKLVVLGGYCTQAVESIGKIWLRDNDGPMGLTRSNASVTETSKWTWFPMSGLIGNSWNKELAYEYGKAVANEGVATGVHGWYAPGANLRRNPFGGRNNEYYSEDPILSGYIAANTVAGAIKGNLAPYMKHFALNETETNRTGLFTWATEQNIRENYLKTFEIAVKVGKANGMMTAFNRIGSFSSISNRALCTDILRTEWGFNGAVVTDWAGGAGDCKNGVAAGNDLWLNGAQNFSHNLGSNWEKDPIISNQVRRACHNILFQLTNTQYVSGIEVIKDVKRPFPYWMIGVVAINVVFVGGALTLGYFAFLRKKKEPELENKKEK